MTQNSDSPQTTDVDASRSTLCSLVTPTSAIEIVRHIRGGGRCLVQVEPHGIAKVHYPREVEEVRMDKNGEWWFGVTMWAFQWFQFPSKGLIWTLC